MGIEVAVAAAVGVAASVGGAIASDALSPDDDSDDQARKAAMENQRARQTSFEQFLARQRMLGTKQLRAPGLKI